MAQVAGELGRAHHVAGGEMHVQLLVAQAQRAQALHYLQHVVPEARLVAVGQDQQELVAAVAIAVLGAKDVQEGDTRPGQDVVAALVAMVVVDLLEVVEVDHRHALWLVALGVLVVVAPQGKAVAQAREGVHARGLCEQGVVALELLHGALERGEGLRLGALERAHEKRDDHDARGGDDHFLQVHVGKAEPVVPLGKEVERVAKHHERGRDASGIAEQRRADHQACDQDHVGVGGARGDHGGDERQHNDDCDGHACGRGEHVEACGVRKDGAFGGLRQFSRGRVLLSSLHDPDFLMARNRNNTEKC